MSPRELRQALFDLKDQDNCQVLVKVGDKFYAVTGLGANSVLISAGSPVLLGNELPLSLPEGIDFVAPHQLDRYEQVEVDRGLGYPKRLTAEINPTMDELLKAGAAIMNPNPRVRYPATLYEILQNKGKVTFKDGSGIEYAEVVEDNRHPINYLKAIAPGGKTWAYPFSQESVNTILLHLVGWVD